MNAWAVRHLWSELWSLHERLRAAVERRRALNSRLRLTAAAGLSVGAQEIDDALTGVEARAIECLQPSTPTSAPGGGATDDTRSDDVRAQAHRNGATLPLDDLTARLRLDPWERACLVLCAAVELDAAYGRIVAYLRDETEGHRPTCSALAELLGEDELARAAIVRGLGPTGRLLRCGLVRRMPERRGELVLEPLALELLAGGRRELAELFLDPDEIVLGDIEPPPAGIDRDALAMVSHGAERWSRIVLGAWGPDPRDREQLARYLARRLERRLFVVHSARELRLHGVLGAATAVGALVWWDEDIAPRTPEEGAEVRSALLRSPVPIVITGRHPWRPLWLLGCGRYLELTLGRLDLEGREHRWREALPDATPEDHLRLAMQYEMGAGEIAAVAAIADTRRALATNGTRPLLAPHVTAATTVVTRRATLRCATVIEPRRGPSELILEPRLHARVLEIPALHRASHEIARRWQLDRLVTGRAGARFLFSGDSGTGKSLAAEVIAGELSAPMLRVDLAQIVSKWVGETEKNLEAVFEEAEVTHAVLFFDEGDALFGKRSEVRHGTDRWANLEVSFMLQRLEDHPGLVILATNLHENIDDAFVRRFQGVLYFPRPQLAERRRLWHLALVSRVPLAADVSLDRLSQLELTGASIVDVSRTAAMLAVLDGRDRVGITDLVEAIQRDFHRHGRCYPGGALQLAAGA